MCGLKRVEFGREVGVSVFMAGSTILKFWVEPSLHFSLLEEHLLPNLIDSLLILNCHRVSDPADLLSRLSDLTLHVIAAHLALWEARVQLIIDLCEFAVWHRLILQLSR